MRCARWIWGLAVFVATSCDYPRLPKLAGDGGSRPQPACSASQDCKTAELPVCDTAKEGGQCVACTATDHGACGGTTPRCETDSCVACKDDGDCPNSVCLLNGACADAATVVHVAKDGITTTGCGLAGAKPCTLEAALTNARTSGQTIIKVDSADTYASDSNINFRAQANVTIDLRIGATLSRHNDNEGAVITVNDTGKLTLLGGVVTGGRNSTGDGIACNPGGTLVVDDTHITGNDRSGVNASSCSVTVTRARIDGNNLTGSAAAAIRISGGSFTLARSWIQGNRGGGLVLGDAVFTIIGNVFVNNGDPGIGASGVAIQNGMDGSRFDFNSIAGNKAAGGTVSGVSCDTSAAFTATNNIIWNNRSNGVVGLQVIGSCGYAYSDIGPTAITAGIPTSNLQNIDPAFTNETTDLHLSANSPLNLLQADPQANVSGVAAFDIDGDVRTAPVTMGADQPRAK